MKTDIERKRKLFLAKGAVVLAVIPVLIWAHEYGSDAGYCNVPKELGTCAQAGCHVGTANSSANKGGVAVNFASGTTYTPGVKQHLTVTVSDPATTQRAWGFQLTARNANASGTMAGTFASTDPLTTLMCASPNLGQQLEVDYSATKAQTCPASLTLQYIEHSLAGYNDSRGKTGSYTFQFDWTPPATNVGNIIIYVAANAANGDLTVNGDHIYTTTYTLTPPGGGSDLAQGKAATQSSTFPGYTTAGASAAVDGNSDGNFFDGSVTATDLDPDPWWQVDLGASATVNSIVIWNRTDCCGSRLNDYWVFVSDTPFLATDTAATLQNRAGTFASHQTGAPNPSATTAVESKGRYVRVQLTSANYLSVAEVQVFGTGLPAISNLAQGKGASQSSTFPGYPTAGAASAVDGNPDGDFSGGSVTATNLDSNAWWQVDLGASATVSSIVIWNRTDCCGSRLGDYWVFVSDTPFLPTDTPATLQFRAGTFSSHQTTAPNPSTTIPTVIHPCPPGALCPDFLVPGRYVRIQLSSPDYLSLAEVQVYGTGGAPPPANLAQGKSASQSSTFPGFTTDGASVAVDGNTDGNFADASVTATSLDPDPWWQVDLGASATIGSIIFWNRTDCCGSRLNDYWVFVSDTPFLPTDTPDTLQSRPGTFGSHQTSAPNPSTTIAAGARGRYVRVQLSGPNYLSLAEVQVFGQ